MIRRALVIEDETYTCELIQDVLISAGVEPFLLSRSVYAASYLRNEQFDIILLNFHMPEPAGVELAREIRRPGINQRTPIIMMSDDEDPAAMSEGLEAGVNFFICKPIDRGQLAKLIRVTQGIIEQERRRFRRVPILSRVQLRVGQVELEGETIDISLNGLLVKSERTLAAGSTAQISLHLAPGIRPVVGRGSIVRSVGTSQMGVQLSHLSRSESARLEQFLLPLLRIPVDIS